jgi:hypothetical protein
MAPNVSNTDWLCQCLAPYGAFTAGIGGKKLRREQMRILDSFIIPAAKSEDPLPPDPKGVALLESKIREAALSAQQPELPLPSLPIMARNVSGRAYKLEPNPYGLSALSLVFEGTREAILRLTLAGEAQTLELPVGLDNVSRIAPGRSGVPAAAKGYWEADNILVVDLDEVANINHWLIRMTFEDRKIAVQMREMTGLDSTTIKGNVQN